MKRNSAWPFRFVILASLFACPVVASAQAWIQLNPSGQAPPGILSHAAVYDSGTNQMIVFGGVSQNHVSHNEVWVLSNANGIGGTATWTLLFPTGGPPPSRGNHSAIYDPANNRLIVFGGFPGGVNDLAFGDVWVLTNANGLGGAPQWIQLSPTGGGPNLAEHTAIYDSSTNRMTVFGGCSGTPGTCGSFLSNNVWVLTNANGLGGAPQWIQLSPTGLLPQSRTLHSATYDPSSNTMTIFGGGYYLNDTWILTSANGLGGTPQWIQLSPSGVLPPARNSHTAVYHSETNRMTIFAGLSSSTELNDVWVLNNANGANGQVSWTQLSTTGTAPLIREQPTSVYDGVTDRMVVFGGFSNPNLLSDLWLLTAADGLLTSQLGVVQSLPNHGGNAGTVTVQIIGSGFQNGATVNLVGSGADILGSNTSVLSATVLTTTFDLIGATTGVRNVVISNPDGTSVTLVGGFTVEQGGAPQILVEIVGRDKIRIGSAQTYYLVLQNSGNVDSAPGLASLSVPNSIQYAQQSGASLFSAGGATTPDYAIPSATNTSNVTLLYATAGIPASSSQFAPVQLTVPVAAVSAALAAPAASSFTLTGGWRQDLANMSLDDFLGFEQIPFISYPSGGCAACLNAYAAELLAYSNVAQPYRQFQTAQADLISAFSNLPVDIGRAVAKAVVVSQIPGIGGVLVDALIAQANTCAKTLSDDIANHNGSCLANLKEQGVNAANSVALFLGTGLNHVAESEIRVFIASIDILGQAIDGIGKVFDAYDAMQLAYGTFAQALGPYQSARAAYQSCLSPAQCSTPPTPPLPPNPPGTTPLPITPVSALDPNDKTGSKGAGASQYVAGGVSLPYAIYFSNEATATAPAQQVVASDQLDIINENLNTLSLGPISFGSELVSPLPSETSFTGTVDLRPATNLLVAISANLNPSTGLLSWNLQSLDPTTNLPPTDPTVGFLAPGEGGSLFFTVTPKQGLATNTQINNQASIVFDTNPAISTPVWLNTLDNTPPVSKVSALPAFETSLSFPVQWAGTDLGAGVQDYTIYSSDNGGPFTAFQTNTTATSATFAAQAGHSYSFYSIARDLVGNVEPAKSAAEATTQTGQTFSSLTARAEITTNPKHPSFELSGTLSLGTGSTGIAPDKQPVSLVLGSFSTVIPAGSFRKSKSGTYMFAGVINGVSLEFTIASAGSRSFGFHIEAAKANLAGTTNPVSLELLIGDNGGTTQINADISSH